MWDTKGPLLLARGFFSARLKLSLECISSVLVFSRLLSCLTEARLNWARDGWGLVGVPGLSVNHLTDLARHTDLTFSVVSRFVDFLDCAQLCGHEGTLVCSSSCCGSNRQSSPTSVHINRAKILGHKRQRCSMASNKKDPRRRATGLGDG